jgi:hypothetical protein
MPSTVILFPILVSDFFLSFISFQNFFFGRISKIAKSDYQIRHVCLSLRLSTYNNSAPIRRIFTKFCLTIFRKSVEKIQVSLKSDKNNGYLHEDLRTFMTIPCWILFKMRNALTNVVEKIKTHILRSITFFRESCRLRDNVEKYSRTGRATDCNIIGRMRSACWITKATDTHSEYVILIAFPGNYGYTNAPRCDVIRTLPVLFFIHIVNSWLPSGVPITSHIYTCNITLHTFVITPCIRKTKWGACRTKRRE